MEAASVQTCVTSPPYFGLRDYGTGEWEGGAPDCSHEPADTPKKRGLAGSTLGGGKKSTGHQQEGYGAACGRCGAVRTDNQIGLEPTPDEFVAALVEVFREVRRVLRDDGTVWLNLGDSYSGSGKGVWSAPDEVKKAAGIKETYRPSSDPVAKVDTGLKSKDLIGIPWRVAFALQADGWYLRQDIIWAKPNPMPESVLDRCTKAHEYIFLLSKGPRYFFDAAAIAEESIYQPGGSHTSVPQGGFDDKGEIPGQGQRAFRAITETRNKRSVWTVASKPFADAHFATYPPALIEPCILAGCPVGGTVLDPFGGAGTTALVADGLGRNAVLIELNPEYAAMAERRLNAAGGMFIEVKVDATVSDASTTDKG